ncbi:hypothetical protein QBC32DRAFT_392624 [Pseudoneurospora amorphoporcata]|uniref:Myb-like domain-containing protein n=1 Tax=Pseudoneurospora amorphoporcata TaxID=241081 RepID=A0AAN6SIZ6_9PEZI|nr:hypothetical protein QBC32DRAFT_392624 [Pseudoneurospora amorphoporcata]
MAPSGRKKGKEVDRSPASILKHGEYTVSLTSWLAGGPAVVGKKPHRVLDLKVERDRKSGKSDQSLVLASKKDNTSDMEVGTSGDERSLTHTAKQRRQTEGSSGTVVGSRPFLTYEEERVEKFTIRPPPLVFNNPEDVPTGWLEAMLDRRKNGEGSKVVPKKAISYEHSDSDDYEASYASPHSKSKSMSKKSSSSSRKASEIRIKTKSSSKKGTRKVEVTTADTTDDSSSDVESHRPTKTKKLEHRIKTKERSKVESSDEETDDATADSESSDVESTSVELRSRSKSKKKPNASSKKVGSAKVKIETRDKKGKRKAVLEASNEEEESAVESMSEPELSPPRKAKSKNRVTVTETTRKGKKTTVTVESSDEADTTHIKSRSSTKGRKSEVHSKASDKAKTKKVSFETTDEAEITDDATTDAEPIPEKAQKGKGKGQNQTKSIEKEKNKSKKKVEVESSDPAETTEVETTEAETTEAATTEAETTDVETTVAEKPKETPAGKADDDWTPSQDAMLLGMKEGGESWANIGKAIGRNKKEVIKRHQELVRTGVAQVNKGNHNKNNKKGKDKENKNNDKNDANSGQTPAAEETFGFGDLPGFGAGQDDNNDTNNNNNNNGDAWGEGGDQNNGNNDNNGGDAWGGGGDQNDNNGGGWDNSNQNDNNGGGDVGPGFNAPAWGADCTGDGDQNNSNNDTTNNNDNYNNNINNDNNNGFGGDDWGGGDQDNNGGGNVGPGTGDGNGWSADCTGGNDKPPSNAGSKNGSNQVNKPPSNRSNLGNKPPSNSGGNNVGSNQGSNNHNKPPTNSGGSCNNCGGSNQGNKPPSNNGQGGGSNQGNRPPSNSGNNGWNGGSNQGNKPPSNSGGNNGGSNQGSSHNNKPPSNSGGNWNNGGSNQGNRPPSNRPPSNTGDWGNNNNNGGWASGSNQGNHNYNKPPSNAGSARGSNHGHPPSNNGGGGWGSSSNSGNRPPSNSGNTKPTSNDGWGGGSNYGRPPSNSGGGWGSSSNSGNKPPSNKPPSNNTDWNQGPVFGDGWAADCTKPPSNNGGGWGGGGSNQGNNPPSNSGGGGWGSSSNDGFFKPPSNNSDGGSNRASGSGSQKGDHDPKANKSMEKEISRKDKEIQALKERVSEEKFQRLDAEVLVLKMENMANKLLLLENQNKQQHPEKGMDMDMGWNTGGSDNNWRPPSAAAGSVRGDNKPSDGWKSRPASGEKWGVAQQNPDYKLPSNSGWGPRDFVPPLQGISNPPTPSNNNAPPPGTPKSWEYGSPTESERIRTAKKVEGWKGSISLPHLPEEKGEWGTAEGGWPAISTPPEVKELRLREKALDKITRGRSPAARSSASAKDWKQGLTRVDEEPVDKGYDMWKKPSSNNGKPGRNAGHKSAGNFNNNNRPSGEQYGWNSGPNAAAAGNGNDWDRGLDRVSTPSFKAPEKDEWAGGMARNDEPRSNKPPSNKGDWTPGLGAAAGWKADCTKAPSNSGWAAGSNHGNDNKPISDAGSAAGSNHGKPPSNNGGWGNYGRITGDPKNNNKAPGSDGSNPFKGGLPPWAANCTEPWDGTKPANNNADKEDNQNALNIHTVTDLPGYNRDVAPTGLSGFPPVVDHYHAPVPVHPKTPTPYSGPPGRYPSTPYADTPHPPGYLTNTQAHTTILPLYNHPPHDQYPSRDDFAPWNTWDTDAPKPATTKTKPPGGPSYQAGQRSAQCSRTSLSEEDVQSLYRQVIFNAMSSRQPLPQPKPDRDFSLRDCWVLIALHDQYDRSSASKEKWFDLQAKFASATGGRMVDPKVLRAKVKEGEREAKIVEGWADDEVGGAYRRSK